LQGIQTFIKIKKNWVWQYTIWQPCFKIVRINVAQNAAFWPYLHIPTCNDQRHIYELNSKSEWYHQSL
jgi:hypothetical protein